MRKIIVSLNITIDGFIAGPDCELDWHFENWAPDMAAFLCEQLSMADTILLGRITYCAMAGYWPGKSADLSLPREDIAFADMMNNYQKVVVSSTLTRAIWNNTHMVTGNIRQAIGTLKRLPGKNIIVYGSGQLVTSLIRLNLVDEYVLWMHPLILGKGKPLFKGIKDRLNMRLENIKTFQSGVVALHYRATNSI
jgi:dihydrofolate reductase